jgi:hypothetical protein
MNEPTLNEPAARAIFDRAAEGIPSGPALVDDLVRGGTRIRRRRRYLQVTAVAATAALVGAGALLFQPGGGDRSTPVDGPTATVSVPPGTRLVGDGRIVVAVPESWTTDDTQCNVPRSNTVAFRDIALNCTGTPDPSLSALFIEDFRSGMFVRDVAEAERVEEMDGVEVAFFAPERLQGPGEDTDPPSYVGSLVVEAEGVAMTVVSPDQQTIEEVLASVALLPDGQVTIPRQLDDSPEDVAAGIEQAGLEVDVVEVARPRGQPGYRVEARPAFGSVVPVGSTVTLLVATPAAEE